MLWVLRCFAVYKHSFGDAVLVSKNNNWINDHSLHCSLQYVWIVHVYICLKVPFFHLIHLRCVPVVFQYTKKKHVKIYIARARDSRYLLHDLNKRRQQKTTHARYPSNCVHKRKTVSNWKEIERERAF